MAAKIQFSCALCVQRSAASLRAAHSWSVPRLYSHVGRLRLSPHLMHSQSVCAYLLPQTHSWSPPSAQRLYKMLVHTRNDSLDPSFLEQFSVQMRHPKQSPLVLNSPHLGWICDLLRYSAGVLLFIVFFVSLSLSLSCEGLLDVPLGKGTHHPHLSTSPSEGRGDNRSLCPTPRWSDIGTSATFKRSRNFCPTIAGRLGALAAVLLENGSSVSKRTPGWRYVSGGDSTLALGISPYHDTDVDVRSWGSEGRV